jgi:hypothetical protein
MCFWNTKIDGLFLISAASFHILGKLKIGSLFTDAKWWAGMYGESAFRKSRLGFLTLFVIQVSWNESGNFPWVNLCINLRIENLIKSSRGKILFCLNRRLVWSLCPACEIILIAFAFAFETLKPYSQETAQNFEKHVLQKCLRIAFYTYIPMNLYHFLK